MSDKPKIMIELWDGAIHRVLSTEPVEYLIKNYDVAKGAGYKDPEGAQYSGTIQEAGGGADEGGEVRLNFTQNKAQTKGRDYKGMYEGVPTGKLKEIESNLATKIIEGDYEREFSDVIMFRLREARNTLKKRGEKTYQEESKERATKKNDGLSF